MCETIRKGNLIDLIEIDAASNRGIDEIRELKEKINFAPTRAKNKIYIIDEVHMLTKEAFNALLKTLEEPPSHVFFVLATTESHKVPETIISRCQRFDFKRITKKTIATRLMYIAQMEEIEAEEAAVEAIAHSADGGLRDAIGLLEQLTTENKLEFERVRAVLGITGITVIESFYKHLKNNETNEALGVIHDLYSQGSDLVQFTKDFLEHLRLEMLKATENGNNAEVSYALNITDIFQDAYNKLKITTIPQLPLEMSVIKSTMHTTDIPVAPVEATAASEAAAPATKTEEPKPDPAPAREHSGIKQKEPEPEIEPEIQTEKIPLTISYVKENWPRVLELIKTPFVRMSFKAGKPIQVENNEITIEFDSKFHREQVDNTENKVEIENAIAQVFEDPAKVKYTVAEVKLSASTPEPEPDPEQPESKPNAASEPEPEKQQKSEKDQPDLANAALDMFGGELVED
jgi:DNA polymerase-3 subunit gamma/tau